MVVNEHDYKVMFGENSVAGTPYSFCCWQILAGIRAWINKTNFQGEITYFYEAGHDSMGEANAVMNRIFKEPHLREGYRYAGHGFVDKKKVRPVQTADILAWHWATQMKRWLNILLVSVNFDRLGKRLIATPGYTPDIHMRRHGPLR
jgi:hypothetical protein